MTRCNGHNQLQPDQWPISFHIIFVFRAFDSLFLRLQSRGTGHYRQPGRAPLRQAVFQSARVKTALAQLRHRFV
jgi:hypothetical protein